MKCPKTPVPKYLGKLFYKYGGFVARHPYMCMLLPVLVTCALLVGLINGLEYKSDAVFLYVPTNAPSRDDRLFIQRKYAYDKTKYFDSLRSVGLDGFMQVTVEPKKGSNLMTDEMFAALAELDEDIRGFSTTVDGRTVTFQDVCGAWEGDCTSTSPLLEIYKQNGDEIESVDISYPYHQFGTQFFALMYSLSDVTTDSNGLVKRARLAKLSYSLATHTQQVLEDGNAWLDHLKPEILNRNDPNLHVYLFNSLTIEQELESNTQDLPVLFSIAFTVLFTFSVLTTIMKDGVRSKTWVAVAGMQATVLAMASSVGLMACIGKEFASVVGSMPFLIVGKLSL